MTNGGASVVMETGGQPPDGNLERRVAIIEAALPTLATKADLACAEMRLEREKLRADIRSEGEKLRYDMRSENAELCRELRELFNSLQNEIRTSQDELCIEMQNLSANLVKWMIANTLSLMIVFAVLLR